MRHFLLFLTKISQLGKNIPYCLIYGRW